MCTAVKNKYKLLYLNLTSKNQVTLPTDNKMFIKNALYLNNEATKC